MPTPRPGDTAPELELTGPAGRTYRLADYRGRPVVVAFYPHDGGSICTRQLRSYRDAYAELRAAGAEVLAVSTDDRASHERFAAEHDLPFPLLTDEDGDAIARWGVAGGLAGMRRAVFVVDPAGRIRFAHVSATGATYKKPAVLLRAVEAAVGDC